VRECVLAAFFVRMARWTRFSPTNMIPANKYDPRQQNMIPANEMIPSNEMILANG